MANRFDKYLQRLYARRISTPELDSYRNLSRGMAPTVKSIEFATKGGIREAGGSIGAQAQLGLRSHQALQSAATDRFGIASREAGARNAVLDQQIDQVTMQRDAEREAGKDNALQTALRVGGTVAGAAIGTVVNPGAGTMLGAKLGSSLGQIGAGFVGGGGEMGLEYADPAQITQGIADIAMSISSASTLKEQKDMAKKVGGFISTNMNDEAKLEAMRLAIMIGPEAVDKLFSTVGSPDLPDFEISGNNGSGTEAQMKAQMQAQLDSIMQGITNPQPSQTTDPGVVNNPNAVVPETSRQTIVNRQPINYKTMANDTPSVDPSIDPGINQAQPTIPTPSQPEEQRDPIIPNPDPADALYYQNGDSRVQFSNQAPVGYHRVGQGQLFSRRTRDGVLLIKVNGFYKVLRRADNSPIQVRAGQQVTVNEDGTITVGGE